MQNRPCTMSDFKIYAGGEFISTNAFGSVVNPYSNEIVARYHKPDSEVYEKAVLAAISSREQLLKLTSFERSNILHFIANGLEAKRQYHGELLSLESGKPIRFALSEVDRAIQTFRVAAEETKRWPQESLDLDWSPAGKGKRGYVKYFPVGLVAGISPFNFPLNLAVHKIAPAIASACPIVLKPASSTPLSTLALAKIIHDSDLPKGAVSILPMDRSMGNKLVEDARFALLSFTGSPEVGWSMKTRAGKKKIVLELGGNAGVIVSATADVRTAAAKCVVGGFSYSGQVCIHTQRIYVHKAVRDEFSRYFLEGVASLKYGDPLNPETDISAMIDEANALRIEEWVNESISMGANLLAGGKREGNYFQPTVLSGTNQAMKVCSGEVFGPVVTLETFEDFDEALQAVNEGRYGLQAGVFTDSIHEMEWAWHRLETGGVIINDVPTFRVDHMPYGGIKDSGLGREGVRYAMLDMLEPKLMVR